MFIIFVCLCIFSRVIFICLFVIVFGQDCYTLGQGHFVLVQDCLTLGLDCFLGRGRLACELGRLTLGLDLGHRISGQDCLTLGLVQGPLIFVLGLLY